MNLKKKIAIALLALTLAPAYIAAQEKAQDKELKATVVSKDEKTVKVKTKEGEKTLRIGKSTKGIENAKEGAKVTIMYSEKDGELRASEIK